MYTWIYLHKILKGLSGVFLAMFGIEDFPRNFRGAVLISMKYL